MQYPHVYKMFIFVPHIYLVSAQLEENIIGTYSKIFNENLITNSIEAPFKRNLQLEYLF